MFIIGLDDCVEFLAGDHTRLKELLHPNRQPLDLRYSLALALVEPGLSSLRHVLKNSEVYYIIRGEGIMSIDGEEAPVGPGQAVYIPPGSEQFITNTSSADLEFICIVDPAWREEDEVIR